MNDWLIWGIIVVAIFGTAAIVKYVMAQKRRKVQKDFDQGVEKINKDIAEKVKRDEAAGMKKAEEIRAKAMADAKKEE